MPALVLFQTQRFRLACAWVGAASNNCQDQLSFASSSQRHESAERASRELFVVMTGVI